MRSTHSVPVTRRALVIGGGVAGIQAALDIADSGYEVVLVEREPSIGGKMAGLSETFPTLDCSQCILTPRMVEAGQHPRIKLHTFSEVEAVEGFIGNFEVTIRNKARYVDIDEVHRLRRMPEGLPAKRNPSEFDYGMGMRPAIYMPFPQAVPARPVIDKKVCAKIIRNGCGLCEKKCAPGAINFKDEDRLVKEKVGAIVVATGYKLYDIGSEQLPRSQRLRRIRLWQIQGRDRLAAVRAAGFGLGAHQRRTEAALGRQDSAERGFHFLRRLARQRQGPAVLLEDLLHVHRQAHHAVQAQGAFGQAHVFYMDIRAGGKGYDEFVRRAIEQDGAKYYRGRVSKITE